MSQVPTRTNVSVGITNTRMSATKRRIAVDVARNLRDATGAQVCLVGADPTDHDVQRRLPDLLASGPSRRMQLRHGAYTIDVTHLSDQQLTIVTLSDRAVIDPTLTRLKELFPFIVIDAPSLVGAGIGIARAVLTHLDGLVVATGMRAGDLALTRMYLGSLESIPAARTLDIRVVLTGSLSDLTPEQLRRLTRPLPLFNDQRHLVAREIESDDTHRVIAPLVQWILALTAATVGPAEDHEHQRTAHHINVAVQRYTEFSTKRD